MHYEEGSLQVAGFLWAIAPLNPLFGVTDMHLALYLAAIVCRKPIESVTPSLSINHPQMRSGCDKSYVLRQALHILKREAV